MVLCLVQGENPPHPKQSYLDNLGLPFHWTYNGLFSISLLALEGNNSEDLQKESIWTSTRVISNTLLLYLQDYATETKFINPCYPQNYNTTFTEAQVFGSLCTEDLRPERYNPNNIITFEGTGDPSLCREKVAFLFNFSACHDHEACSFDGVYQPRVKGSFVVRAKQQRFLFPLLIISHLPVFPLLSCFPLSFSLP